MPNNIGRKNNEQPSDSLVERRLESWLQSEENAGMSPGTQERIVRMLRPSIAAVKPISSQRRLTTIFLGIVVLCVAAAILVTGWAGIHLMTGAQIACMMAIFIAGALLVSFSLAALMVPGSPMCFPLSGVLALSGTALISGIALVFPWRILGPFLAEGWRCAVLEVAIAVPAAVLLWLVVRRGAPFPGPGLGAAIAGLSVFLALIVVQSQCMFPQAPHILIWHAGIAALLVLCGALAGLASRRVHLPS